MIFLYLVPALAAAFAFGAAVRRQTRSARLAAAWDSGHTAGARCVSVRAEEVSDADGRPVTVHRHVLEFTAADGRAVRYEEAGAPETLREGEAITVYYAPGAPEQATVLAPSTWRRHAGTLTTAVMAALAVLVVSLCAAFL